MSLRSIAQADVDTVFFESGGWKETVSYLPHGQTSGETSISVIVEDIQDPSSGGAGFDSDMMPTLANTAIIHVSSSEIASPEYGDQITQGSTVWRTRQITKSEGMYLLYCVADERMSR